MHREAVYSHRSSGTISENGNKYDNHVLLVMGGKIKVKAEDYDLGNPAQGEAFDVFYGNPVYRQNGNYLDLVCPIEAIEPASALKAAAS